MFFEEWDEPLISGICWVDELIEIAGGEPIFPELRRASLAKDRIVRPEDVLAKDPEVVIASWCGKAMKRRTIVEREGWDRMRAVRDGHIYEIKSTYILQPGPAALTEGVARLHECIARSVVRKRLNSPYSVMHGTPASDAVCERSTMPGRLMSSRNSIRVRAS